MVGQTAVVIGSTGLIGSQLVKLLLEDKVFSEVRVLVRKPVGFSHPKLTVQMVSFDNYPELKEKIGPAHSCFCCIGTTQKKVRGDKVAYRKVDYDIPVNTANGCIENGVRKFLLVSSVGANKGVKNFYLQLKGSVEETLSTLEFESIHFFRPSLLLGNRKEFRAGERMAQVSMQLLSFLFLGKIKKYKPIHSLDVAKAMIAASKQQTNGVHVYEYEKIMELSKQEST
jgi:uncharacterized protein YbjT (DUF2867 family)